MQDPQHISARDCLRRDDLDGASKLVESRLDECRETGGSNEVWAMRLIRADILRLRGRGEEALGYLTSRETSDPPAPDDVISLAGIKGRSGYFLGHMGQFDAAHSLMGQAEELARTAGLLEPLCEVHQRQAMVLYLQREYASSERVFQEILVASYSVGGWYFRAHALWGIGKNQMIQERYAEAVPWLEQSLALFEGVDARLSMATVWSELAVCHLGLGDDRKSLSLLQNALLEDERQGCIQNYLVGLANIGNVYLHRDDHLTAIAYYRRALELARAINDPVSIQKWSYNLRLAYARLREFVDRMPCRSA